MERWRLQLGSQLIARFKLSDAVSVVTSSLLVLVVRFLACEQFWYAVYTMVIFSWLLSAYLLTHALMIKLPVRDRL